MSLFGKKPATLSEVVRRVRASEQKFDPSLREFLDWFYMNPHSRQQAIEERPVSIDAVHVFTDYKYRNGPKLTATGFANRSSQAVYNR
jgi:hypothetical protein